MTIGITGGTGLVGAETARQLQAQGHEVIVFSRRSQAAQQGIRYAVWHPEAETIDRDALAQTEALIHLAGAGVADKRWTTARRKEIVESRVAGTRFLVDAMRQYAPQCRTFISGSAIGYYGADVSGKTFSEDDPPGNDFLADTCVQWEAEALKAASFMRTVVIRTGIVLARQGGALPKLTQAFPLHVAPVLGNGRQVMSWIHLHDLAALFIHALHPSEMAGIYNGVAPEPQTNKQVMHALAAAKGGVFFYPKVPSAVLKTVLGEMSIEVLKSATVSSAKTEASGFRFRYPKLQQAAEDLLSG